MTDCWKRLLRRFAPRNDGKGRHCERIPTFVIASLQPHTVIASEQPYCVIASLMAIRRSNLLETLNTKRNKQREDCFTPTHLPTLRFAMTDCCKRLLRRLAPRNDVKEGTRNYVKEGTRNDEKERKAFCNKNNLFTSKNL